MGRRVRAQSLLGGPSVLASVAPEVARADGAGVLTPFRFHLLPFDFTLLCRSILAGGMKFREQRFNKTAARTSTTTLTLAAVALAIPTVFHVVATGLPAGGLRRRSDQLPIG
jgi:hypothetical protein